MQIYFTRTSLPNFASLTWNFQSSFHDFFSHLFFLILCLFECKCIYGFYSIKPFHLTETRIYVKIDGKAATTAHIRIRMSGTIDSQWNYVS